MDDRLAILAYEEVEDLGDTGLISKGSQDIDVPVEAREKR